MYGMFDVEVTLIFGGTHDETGRVHKSVEGWTRPPNDETTCRSRRFRYGGRG